MVGENKRIYELNFIRAICAMGIVYYHLSLNLNNDIIRNLNVFPCGVDIGSVFVTAFFILSGVVLFHNYYRVKSIKLFYWKRWKSIFPSFYIVYGIIALIYLLNQIEWYFDKPFYTLPLSLIGMDGYLYALLPTWYIVGEWFLGAIIFLYLLYPVLNYLVRKHELCTWIVVELLFIITMKFNMFNQLPFRNIFSCIFSFTFGLIAEKHTLYKNKFVLRVSVVCMAILPFIPSQFYSTLLKNLAGIFAFFTLYVLGRYAMIIKPVAYVIDKISNVSYEIFLLQHIMIFKVVSVWNPEPIFLTIILMLITMVIIYIVSYIISKFTHFLLKSRLINNLEKRIIAEKR